MITSYHDQVCIVTGASSGIGAAFARELSRQGAKVVLFARRADKLAAVAADLGDHLVVEGDVTKPEDRADLVEKTLKKYGHIDVLINNAGRGDGSKRFASSHADLIEQVIGINFLGLVQLTHQVLPVMLARKRGLIINVSSPLGDASLPGSSLYCSTKAAVTSFSLALYRELRPTGIHVMNLKPGFTRSEMVTEEAKLPGFLEVKTAEEVVAAALKGGLKGKRDVIAAGFPARFLAITARNFPTLGDMLIKRYVKN